jgi:hypothetical protein
MGIYLKYCNLDELTERELEDLKKTLKERQQALQAAMTDVNEGLKMLSKKPKTKGAAKQGTPRRPTKA